MTYDQIIRHDILFYFFLQAKTVLISAVFILIAIILVLLNSITLNLAASQPFQ